MLRSVQPCRDPSDVEFTHLLQDSHSKLIAVGAGKMPLESIGNIGKCSFYMLFILTGSLAAWKNLNFMLNFSGKGVKVETHTRALQGTGLLTTAHS